MSYVVSHTGGGMCLDKYFGDSLAECLGDVYLSGGCCLCGKGHGLTSFFDLKSSCE